MRKLAIAAVGLAFLLGQPVLAKEGGTCPHAKKAAKGAEGCKGKGMCFGTVESVDAAAGTITIKMKDGKTNVVSVTKDTKILKGENALDLKQLEAGTMIKIFCKGEACTAVKVMVKDKSWQKEGKKGSKECPMKK